jgi:hypothetical protein
MMHACQSVYLDRTVAVAIANLVEDSAKTCANAHIGGQTHPVISYVPVHIQERSPCEHKELCAKTCLLSPPK